MAVVIVRRYWLLILIVSSSIQLFCCWLLIRYRSNPIIAARQPLLTATALFVLFLAAGICLPLGRAFDLFPCTAIIWQDFFIIHIAPMLFMIKSYILSFQFRWVNEKVYFYKLTKSQSLNEESSVGSNMNKNLLDSSSVASRSECSPSLFCQSNPDKIFHHTHQHWISNRNIVLAAVVVILPFCSVPLWLSSKAKNVMKNMGNLDPIAVVCMTQGWEQLGLLVFLIEVFVLFVFLVVSRHSFEAYVAGKELRTAAALTLFFWLVYMSAYLTNNFNITNEIAITSLIVEIVALILSYYMSLKPILPLLFFDIPCFKRAPKSTFESTGKMESSFLKMVDRGALLVSGLKNENPDESEVVDFLNSPAKFKALENFMMQEMTVENLYFVLECLRFEEQAIQYRQLVDSGNPNLSSKEAMLLEKAKQIYDSYIVDSAILQVSVDESDRKRLETAFEKLPLNLLSPREVICGEQSKSELSSIRQSQRRVTSLFQSCFEEVLHRISTDSFRRFKSSQEYEEAISAFRRKGTKDNSHRQPAPSSLEKSHHSVTEHKGQL
jgi:hypothetical protein